MNQFLKKKCSETGEELQNLIRQKLEELREKFKEIEHNEDIRDYRDHLVRQISLQNEGGTGSSLSENKLEVLDFLEGVSELIQTKPVQKAITTVLVQFLGKGLGGVIGKLLGPIGTIVGAILSLFGLGGLKKKGLGKENNWSS